MFVRLFVIVCLGATAFVTSPIVPSAHAAPLPSSWCGPGESTDDLPDVVAGAQIHVVYAYASDVPNRSDLWLPRIARDLAGVDSWWQTQDPTRTPRFDMANFADCPSQFGQLDISTIALKSPSSGYNTSDVVSLSGHVRTELFGTLGSPATYGKAYLVYLDVPVALDRVCGSAFPGNVHPGSGTVRAAFVYLQPSASGCDASGGYGSGAGWPARIVAHELLHLLAGQMRGAPHACPNDSAHICGPEEDILKSEGGRGGLLQAMLDPGRDDYYGHGLPERWDARRSAWLLRLDTPLAPVSISIAPAGTGQVVSTVPGINCSSTCSAEFDLEAELELTATPAPGYGFSGWVGECDLVVVAVCTATPGGPITLTARFVQVSPVKLHVSGDGQISSDDEVCRTECSLEAVRGSKVEYIAAPDPGSSFAGWKGACRGTQKRCVIKKVKQAVQLRARFVEKKQQGR